MEEDIKDIELSEIKQQIVAGIKKKYGMSVKDFANSERAKELNLNTRNLQSYLSSGATSLPTYVILCKDLGLGYLEKTVEVKRTEIYKLKIKKKKHGKKSK